MTLMILLAPSTISTCIQPCVLVRRFIPIRTKYMLKKNQSFKLKMLLQQEHGVTCDL